MTPTTTPTPTITLTSTATRAPGDPPVMRANTLIIDCTLLITGGDGNGTYQAQLTLNGETNEGNPAIYEQLGAIATANWPHPIGAGTLQGPAPPGPQFPLTPFDLQQLQAPFTYNQPQHIRLIMTTT